MKMKKLASVLILILLIGVEALAAAMQVGTKQKQKEKQNFCSNGDFEEVSEDGRATGWTTYVSPDGKTHVRPARDAHSGKWAMELRTQTDAPVILNRIYRAPDDKGFLLSILRGVAQFWYKAVSSDGQDNLAFFIIGMNDKLVESAPRFSFIIPKEHIGDGKWHHAAIEFDYRDQPSVKYLQVAPRINESGKRGAGHWIVDDIVIRRMGPRLKLRFGVSKPILPVGSTCKATCVLRNEGDEDAESVSVELSCNDAVKVISTHTKFALKAIKPDETKTVEWNLRGAKGKVGLVSLTVSEPESPAETKGSAGALPSQLSGSRSTHKTVLLPITDEPPDALIVTLRGDSFTLLFHRSSYGFTHFEVVGRSRGKVQPIGIGMLMSELRYRQNGLEKVKPLVPDTVDRRSESPTTREFVGEGGGFACRFSVESGLPLVDVTFRVDLNSKVLGISGELISLSGPTLYLGEGSFGAHKEGGLFGGLEWLVGEESSSSELDAKPGERFLPHPNRITIPVMAICTPGDSPKPPPKNSFDPPEPKGHFLVGLLWDPYQK